MPAPARVVGLERLGYLAGRSGLDPAGWRGFQGREAGDGDRSREALGRGDPAGPGRGGGVPRLPRVDRTLGQARPTGLGRLEKPPLPRWVTATLIALTNRRDEAIVRLPNALAALATIALVYRLGRKMGGRAVGLASGFALASTAYFVVEMRQAGNDGFLALFTTLALLAARERLGAPGDPPGHRGWSLLFSLGLGLGFLTKGPIILLLVGVAILGELATSRPGDLRDAGAGVAGAGPAPAADGGPGLVARVGPEDGSPRHLPRRGPRVDRPRLVLDELAVDASGPAGGDLAAPAVEGRAARPGVRLVVGDRQPGDPGDLARGQAELLSALPAGRGAAGRVGVGPVGQAGEGIAAGRDGGAGGLAIDLGRRVRGGGGRRGRGGRTGSRESRLGLSGSIEPGRRRGSSPSP